MVTFSRLLRQLTDRSGEEATPSLHDPDPRPNHELIFRELKEYTNRQYAQMDSLDAKGGLIAATSTALTGGFVALFNGVTPTTVSSGPRNAGLSMSGWQLSGHTLLFILLGVAFCAYFIVFSALFVAVRSRKWELVPDPSTLLNEYWDATANRTLADLCATMAKAAQDNQPKLDDKIKWIGRSFVLLGCEVGILFLAILVGVWARLL